MLIEIEHLRFYLLGYNQEHLKLILTLNAIFKIAIDVVNSKLKAILDHIVATLGFQLIFISIFVSVICGII